MTTRTASLSILILLSLSHTVAAQTAGKTFTKSFNTDSKGVIRLDLANAIDLKVWDNPSIRIEISVNLPSGNSSVLNELANVGRYNLIATSIDIDDALVITAPNLQKQIRIKGEELKENVSYVVYVPKNVKIEMPNAVMLADVKK